MVAAPRRDHYAHVRQVVFRLPSPEAEMFADLGIVEFRRGSIPVAVVRRPAIGGPPSWHAPRATTILGVRHARDAMLHAVDDDQRFGPVGRLRIDLDLAQVLARPVADAQPALTGVVGHYHPFS